MKTFFMLCTLLISSQTYANQDHESGMEADPGQLRLDQTRACFAELDIAGCGRPVDDRAHFSQCAVDHQGDLAQDCQQLVNKLYQ